MRRTGQFKKDYKKAQQQGRDIESLRSVIEALARGERLPERFRDHSLSGPMQGTRGCHIAPDWVLIYYIDTDDHLVLVRIGSHADLFG